MQPVAFESPGVGGTLHWKERSDGVWHASALGNEYELTPDRHHYGVWVRPQGGQWQSLGRASTLGSAFGKARDYADGVGGSQRAAEDSGELVWKREGDHKVATGRKGRFSITVTKDGGTLLSLDGHTVDTYQTVGQAEKVANHLNTFHEAPTAAEKAPVIHEAGADDEYSLEVTYAGPMDRDFEKKLTNAAGVKPAYVDRFKTHGGKRKGNTLIFDYTGGQKVAAAANANVFRVLKVRGHIYSTRLARIKGGGHEAREDYEHVPRDVEAVRKGRKLGAMHTPAEVYAMVGPTLVKESQECFLVIPLDIHGRPLSAKPYEVARGQRDRVSVDPSDILRPVIKTNALGFLVCHNHPSGACKASEADLALTRTIDEAAEKVGLRMLDHLVVGDGEVYSIREGKAYKVG